MDQGVPELRRGQRVPLAVIVGLLTRLGLSTRAAKPVAILLIVLAIAGVVWSAIALVYRSGSAAGGAKVTTKVNAQRAEHVAQARTDERKATEVTIAIADRTARADALSETLLRTTIQDLRDALDSTPPAAAGVAPPVVPVDRLHDDLNQAIARANGQAGAADAP